ncbi:MAG: hypothetical protein BJ554DRAFT_2450 [Olpidium bornovanus]|uniref:SAC domain-containing protein n=1 Tax=Olpidium bornovanus TaxID=278681 RepID=A0A8H7ZQS9_9FUNG|nr:MAG: hypothetical protein BJ554DRAFT_2450 [Olpidium bornovanus]
MDCLDRTNVVQSAFARQMMSTQLHRLGVTNSPESLFANVTVDTLFNHGEHRGQRPAMQAMSRPPFTTLRMCDSRLTHAPRRLLSMGEQRRLDQQGIRRNQRVERRLHAHGKAKLVRVGERRLELTGTHVPEHLPRLLSTGT